MCRVDRTRVALAGCARLDDESRALYTDEPPCATAIECRERGECTFKEGVCTAGNDADCAASLGCRVHGRCHFVKDTICGAKDDDCTDSQECKAFGRCERDGITCTKPGEQRGAYDEIECLRDPGCASDGRCLRAPDGRCMTPAEAGI